LNFRVGFEPFAQSGIDTCLPTCTAAFKRTNHVGIQADVDVVFRVRQYGSAPFGLEHLLGGIVAQQMSSISLAGRALANHSAVASGASSSVRSGLGVRGISVPFALVGSTQADHPALKQTD
jgi:hypothetical protein